MSDASLDSSWESGPGGFGFGDGDDATVLSNMRNFYTTVYIRKSFNVSAIETNRILRLTMDWDDGFVAYLDGVEVARSSNAGPPGTVLPHTSGVSPDHEASVDSGLPPEVFELGPVGGRLSPGTHILALQGLNGDLGSSDVTLKADLGLADSVTGGTAVFDGLFALVYSDSIVLSGTNTHAGSVRVTVNGVDATFDPASGGWSKAQSLQPGMNRLFIAAVDASGAILTGTNKHILYESSSTAVGGTLSSNASWVKSMGVIRLTNDLTIANGSSLTIEPGVVVLLPANVSLRVRTNSAVAAVGTELEPIYFLPANGTTPWGEMSALGTNASMSLNYAEIVAGQVRILRDATITVENSVLRDMHVRQMVEGDRGSQLIFRRTHFNRYAQAHVDYTPTLLEDCLFENITSDAMDFAGNPAAIVVRRCTWRNGSGGNTDAIDLGSNRDLRVEDCLIHDFPDKAISIAEGSHNTTVSNVLIYNVGSGVNMYASSNGVFSHVTVADSGYGLRLYVRDGFVGPGHAVASDIISWHNVIPLEVTNNATLTLEYSDIEGTQAYPGLGNIVADPLFRDRGQDDYRLSPGSPALGTGRGGSDMGVIFPVGGIPPAPFNFSAVGADATSVTLRWSENADNEAGFVIYRSIDGTNWQAVASVGPNTTEHLDLNLVSMQQYFYQARATNHAGPSRLSNLALATPAPAAGLPPAPTNLAVVSVQPNQVNLSWTYNSPAETGFVLEHSSNNVTWCACTIVAANNTSAAVTDAFISGVLYYFRIKATNSVGSSLYSNVAVSSTDPSDLDADGMPNSWENQFGFDPSDPAEAAEDADGDGLDNRGEYRAGTHPKDPASVLEISSVRVVAPGEVELQFRALANRAYALEYRNSLASGVWQNLIDIPADTFDRAFTVTDFPPSSAKSRFYRLIIP